MSTIKASCIITYGILLFLSSISYADKNDQCLVKKIKTAASTTTVGELITDCTDTKVSDEIITDNKGDVISTSKARLLRENSTQWSPYVLTAHKQNYLLIYSHASDQNLIYQSSGDNYLAEQKEAKFQMSVKVPLTENSLFLKGDSLHVGLTMKSFWQLYNNDASVPLRETDYAPEIFYTVPLATRPNDAETAIRIGFEHESNGRTQLLSRSWNRVYTQFFYAKDNYLLTFRPWYRIAEDKKVSFTDPKGDDNSDIGKYMGNFELTAVITHKDVEFSSLLRNNLRSDNYGAIELGASFPLWGRIRGYAQYFNGYGESLIDYNHRMERIGFGILITDLM